MLESTFRGMVSSKENLSTVYSGLYSQPVTGFKKGKQKSVQMLNIFEYVNLGLSFS